MHRQATSSPTKPPKSTMNREKRRQIFQRWQQANPHPTTELIYRNPFELLIAVLLSAQATDVSVNKATAKLFALAPDPQAMLDLGLDGIIDCIKTIGLYQTKAKHIIQTCQILLLQHQGQVPDNRAALEALPGVGRKTANVVLNTAFGQAVMAVDTHIFRLANRMNLAPGKDVREVEDKLMKLIPKEFLYNAHHWLILHGRYICRARSPQCHQCHVADLCEYPNKTVPNIQK